MIYDTKFTGNQLRSNTIPNCFCKKADDGLKGEQKCHDHWGRGKKKHYSYICSYLVREFLPVQLIYGGKTEQSLPRYKFPNSFCPSVNEKHYSKKKESIKFFNEVIIPYIKEVHLSENLTSDQYALVIMDVFTGQMTSDVLNLL